MRVHRYFLQYLGLVEMIRKVYHLVELGHMRSLHCGMRSALWNLHRGMSWSMHAELEDS